MGRNDSTLSASTPVNANWINVAIPGGLRALMADGLWLRTYVAWTARDGPRTEMLIRLVAIADGRPVDFWINGARIIACDIAEWRLASADGDRMPGEVRRRIVEEQAQLALKHLTAAAAIHPRTAAIRVEMGNIHLYRRRDLAQAAACYRLGAECPDAPFFAARIYAEILRRLGRDREAYAWLCSVYPGLPADDERAMRDVVLGRMLELEKRLDLPVQERYTQTVDSNEPACFQRSID